MRCITQSLAMNTLHMYLPFKITFSIRKTRCVLHGRRERQAGILLRQNKSHMTSQSCRMNRRELERRKRTHANQYRYASKGDTRFHTCTFTVYLAAACNNIPTAMHDLFSDPTFQFNIL
jgi:hypothetical protein